MISWDLMGVSDDVIGLSDLVGFNGDVMGFNWLYVCGFKLIHLISCGLKAKCDRRTAW